jgi:hypothetical protein
LDRVVGSVSFGNCGNAMGGGAGNRNEAVKKPETTVFKKNGCVTGGKVTRKDLAVLAGENR